MNTRIRPGMRFGRWVVSARAPTRSTPSGAQKAYWVCHCECGEQREVRSEHLNSGRTLSCGCHRRDAAAEQSHVHGGRHTPLYDVWMQMIQRCENPRNKGFKRYGARGINVCERWHDFAAFQSDNTAYAPGLTIDRKDNDGNYEPSNVRWVPNKVNCRNTPRTLHVEWLGQRVALNLLAEQHGLKPHTVYSRYRLKGWPLHRALGLAGVLN